jgi:hypothetical protein
MAKRVSLEEYQIIKKLLDGSRVGVVAKAVGRNITTISLINTTMNYDHYKSKQQLKINARRMKNASLLAKLLHFFDIKSIYRNL